MNELARITTYDAETGQQRGPVVARSLPEQDVARNGRKEIDDGQQQTVIGKEGAEEAGTWVNKELSATTRSTPPLFDRDKRTLKSR